jgi:hypothetical protein
VTTRKLKFLTPVLLAALSLLALALSGCATPGPLHLYTTASTQPELITDTGAAPSADIPAFFAPGETLTGLAYDPFTDHLFLRLAPGNVVRVVDRPARAIKRTYTVAELPATAGGDLAVRPRDGHIFFAHPTLPALVETDRFGAFIRTLTLATLNAPPAGVAYDAAHNQLLILSGGDLARITTHTVDGARVASVALDRTVGLLTLAFDSDTRELYIPLAPQSPLVSSIENQKSEIKNPPALGVFNLEGHLLRTLPQSATFIDLGPRSLLRLF